MMDSKWVMIGAAICILAMLLASVDEAAADGVRVPKLGCPEKCGNVGIPYPFGIGEDCAYNQDFEITCNHTYRPKTPIYGDNLEVLEIDLGGGHIRIPSYVSRNCYDWKTGEMLSDNSSGWISIGMYPFALSSTKNILAVTGCDAYGWFTGYTSGRKYKLGCMTQCNSTEQVDNRTCTGAGCCATQMPEGLYYLKIEARSFFNYTANIGPGSMLCSSAFVVANDSFLFTPDNLTMNYERMPRELPIIFDWAIGNQTCAMARANGTLLCSDPKSECLDFEPGGYRCSCLAGYSGNPYLPQGCQDIDECSSTSDQICKAPAKCVNTEGSYHCQCPRGFEGNGTIHEPCKQNNPQTAEKIIFTVGGSIILLLILGFLVYCYHGQKQMKQMRDTFFRQNGGLILLQRLRRRDASVEVGIFSAEDLKRATDNYSESNVIGRGGYGVVFKGTLPNQQVVAIKKSLKVEKSQIDQFINEVIVLAQINNRNVVRLLGCCLETEVPLLVYEFIRNGTLYEHLHEERKASLLSWDIRLRIATEVAEVLAYLHTTVSTPIIHRDVKSMNILLDENYVAKVSDFGASRLVPMDKEQTATMVLGTHGYLDPEYMQTSELNEKSDVYSFGVVLLELLTGRMALCFKRPEKERCLAMYFLLQYKEQRVLEIVDQKIMSQGATDQLIGQIMEVAILARRCLELKGEDRPIMKEVAMELDRIRRKDVHPWSSSNAKVFNEEEEYLLSKALEDNGAYDMESTSDTSHSHSHSHSRVVQLIPLNDGR